MKEKRILFASPVTLGELKRAFQDTLLEIKCEFCEEVIPENSGVIHKDFHLCPNCAMKAFEEGKITEIKSIVIVE